MVREEVAMKLDHLGIEVQDLYTMELFYRSVLGFKPRYRYVSLNTPDLRTVFLERDGLSLELLERPRGKDFLSRRPNHIALSLDDVDAEYCRITELAFPGVVIKPPRNTGDGFREVELRDPEGNVVELAARIAREPDYPVRAVIFDLDGTLIDSEPNYYLADRTLLARYGIPFSEEDKRRYIGSSNLDEMADLVRRHGLEATPEFLAEEKNTIYLALAEHSTRIFPQMQRFLELLVADGIPVAVASGSAPEVIHRLLTSVGLAESFDHAVSAEEVPRGKPAPDVFLEAARRLGVPPQTCVVVEDSRPGVEAALRGFMRCIAVPYLTDQPLAPAFGLADLLYRSGMESFDPKQAYNWLKGHI